jgi:hypothetical protein
MNRAIDWYQYVGRGALYLSQMCTIVYPPPDDAPWKSKLLFVEIQKRFGISGTAIEFHPDRGAATNAIRMDFCTDRIDGEMDAR